ncbi:hypothetical protein ACQQ9V_08630 [Hornefia butyriciproducens]|uniref:hypothetical protein n=1 Tax=Hornefia butyriciproducens TaxID=2652293 RepID=UPI003D02268C
MSRTSWQVKKRYDDKTYRRVTALVRKDSDIASFLEEQKAAGESISGIVNSALELYRAALENPTKGSSEPVKGGSDE